MPGIPDEDAALKEHSIFFNYYLQLITLILLNVSLAVVILLIPREEGPGLVLRLVGANGSLLLMTIVHVVLKRYAVGDRLRNLFFLIFILAAAVILQVLTREYGYVLMGVFFVLFAVVVGVTFNPRYYSLLYSLYFLFILLSFVFKPVIQVSLSSEFYVGSLFSLLIAYLVGLQGIRLFQKYRSRLESRIKVTTRHLSEISDLNVQYKKSVEKLEMVLDFSEDGVMDIDVENGSLIMSPKCGEILGFHCRTMEDLEKNLESCLGANDFAELLNLWKKLRSRSLTTVSHEVSCSLKDGKKRLRLNIKNYSTREEDSVHQIAVVQRYQQRV